MYLALCGPLRQSSPLTPIGQRWLFEFTMYALVSNEGGPSGMFMYSLSTCKTAQQTVNSVGPYPLTRGHVWLTSNEKKREENQTCFHE